MPKRRRRLGNTTDMILSLYARGLTARDIKAHLAEVYGIEVSHETVSKVTEVVADEVRAWQARPVDEVYPIVFIDGLRIKVRDGGSVTNRAAHLVVGVDVDGFKHVLGIWMQSGEGAKFWLGVFPELRNRGLRDPLIVCCDGLAGLPEAIATIWPVAGLRIPVRTLPAGVLEVAVLLIGATVGLDHAVERDVHVDMQLTHGAISSSCSLCHSPSTPRPPPGAARPRGRCARPARRTDGW